MKRRAEITFETEEWVVLREGAQVSKIYCDGCGKFVVMATPYAAAIARGLTEREVFRLLENGSVHFAELERVFVCLPSLSFDHERGEE